MSSNAVPLPAAARPEAPHRSLSFGGKLALGWEIVKGGLPAFSEHEGAPARQVAYDELTAKA